MRKRTAQLVGPILAAIVEHCESSITVNRRGSRYGRCISGALREARATTSSRDAGFDDQICEREGDDSAV